MKMNLAVAGCFLVPLMLAGAQQSSPQEKEKPKSAEAKCPMHETHAHDTAAMNGRGEQGMGFSQTTTTHHFLLKPDGGAIQVEVNDPADTNERARIRQHLKHIAQAFAQGDFNIPMFVHDTVPPGAAEMERLREKIRYAFEETANGGRVILATQDKEARESVHKFLRFQIAEHKTGDATEIH
jgi:hypothetical protein